LYRVLYFVILDSVLTTTISSKTYTDDVITPTTTPVSRTPDVTTDSYDKAT